MSGDGRVGDDHIGDDCASYVGSTRSVMARRPIHISDGRVSAGLNTRVISDAPTATMQQRLHISHDHISDDQISDAHSNDAAALSYQS